MSLQQRLWRLSMVLPELMASNFELIIMLEKGQAMPDLLV